MLRAGAEQVEHPALRVVALEQQIGGRGGFDHVPLLAITRGRSAFYLPVAAWEPLVFSAFACRFARFISRFNCNRMIGEA